MVLSVEDLVASSGGSLTSSTSRDESGPKCASERCRNRRWILAGSSTVVTFTCLNNGKELVNTMQSRGPNSRA